MHLSVSSVFVSRGARKILAALLLVAATAATCHAQAGLLSEDSRRDAQLRPGVVYIQVQATGILNLPLNGKLVTLRCDRPATASGSGFIYRPDGYLVTNGHVAQLAYSKDEQAGQAQKEFVFQSCFQDKLEQAFHHRFSDREVAEWANRFVTVNATVLTVVLSNHAPYTGEVKQYSGPIAEGGKDVAIIKIDGNNLPTVPLGDSNTVNVNDKVYTIGYPGAANISQKSLLVATSSDGIISAVKNEDYSGTPLLQTNANINHGNSGGPAFDASGQVIGITTMGSSQASGYNFLVPINTAKEFVSAAGAQPQRGNFDQTWQQALNAYANKEWSKAHKLLSDVLEMMPEQPEAQKLQLQAAANERAESPLDRAEESVGLPAIIGICVAVLAIAGVIVWLMVRKPSQPAPAPAYKMTAQASSVAAGVPGAGPSLGATRLEPPPKMTIGPGAADQSYGSLIVSGGPLTGNRFQVTKAGLTIGRDPAKCTVVLADDSISKEHAFVVPVENGVALIDRNSANGTYVNSTDSPRINKVVLRHGDRVYLGKKNPTVFTYYTS
jgi:serine protease Do